MKTARICRVSGSKFIRVSFSFSCPLFTAPRQGPSASKLCAICRNIDLHYQSLRCPKTLKPTPFFGCIFWGQSSLGGHPPARCACMVISENVASLSAPMEIREYKRTMGLSLKEQGLVSEASMCELLTSWVPFGHPHNKGLTPNQG